MHPAPLCNFFLVVAATLMTGCASRVPLSTPVPFVICGSVVTRDSQPVADAHVLLSEEHSRLFPLRIAPPRRLGTTVTRRDGSFEIPVTTPLRSSTLSLFVAGLSNDSVYTTRVRLRGPTVLRVRNGFKPGKLGTTDRIITERLP